MAIIPLKAVVMPVISELTKLSLCRHLIKIFVYCTVYIHLSFLHSFLTYSALFHLDRALLNNVREQSAKLRAAGRLYMHRKGRSEGVVHRECRRVSLIFEAIGDYCGETPVFLYPSLGKLTTL